MAGAALIADLLRLAVLIEASLVLGFTWVVLRRYMGRYLQAARAGTGGRRKVVPGRRGKSDPRCADTDWIGLLPKHVWLVSVASLLFVADKAEHVARNIGHPLAWDAAPLALIELTLLLTALVTVAQYENRVSGRR